MRRTYSSVKAATATYSTARKIGPIARRIRDGFENRRKRPRAPTSAISARWTKRVAAVVDAAVQNDMDAAPKTSDTGARRSLASLRRLGLQRVLDRGERLVDARRRWDRRPARDRAGRRRPCRRASTLATRTKSTALYFAVRSSVTPTTMPALPSGEALAMATTPEPIALLGVVDERLEILGVDALTARARSFTPATSRASAAGAIAAAAAHGQLALGVGEFAFELLALLDEAARGASAPPRPGRASARRCRAARATASTSWLRAPSAVRGLDAAHAGGDGAFRHDAERGRCRRCATHGCRRRARPKRRERTPGSGAAHGDDAHLVAIFLAEQRARAGCDRLVLRHHPRLDRRIVLHDLIGDRLDARPAPRR